MKEVCLAIGVIGIAFVFIMGAITSTAAIIHGDMSGWGFWTGFALAGLLIYGTSSD